MDHWRTSWDKINRKLSIKYCHTIDIYYAKNTYHFDCWKGVISCWNKDYLWNTYYLSILRIIVSNSYLPPILLQKSYQTLVNNFEVELVPTYQTKCHNAQVYASSMIDYPFQRIRKSILNRNDTPQLYSHSKIELLGLALAWSNFAISCH